MAGNMEGASNFTCSTPYRCADGTLVRKEYKEHKIVLNEHPFVLATNYTLPSAGVLCVKQKIFGGPVKMKRFLCPEIKALGVSTRESHENNSLGSGNYVSNGERLWMSEDKRGETHQIIVTCFI